MGSLRQSRRAGSLALALLGLGLGGCPTDLPPESRLAGKSSADSEGRGLYGAFRQGKFDEAGHPLGARVFAAGEGCRPATGAEETEGWGVWPGIHGAGTLCDVSLDRLGTGAFTLNLRVLTQKLSVVARASDSDVGVESGSDAGVGTAPLSRPAPPLLTLRVLGADRQELGRKTITATDFRARLTYRNVWVSFTHGKPGPVQFELTWSGAHPVRFSYVELFRRARGVRIEPASGIAPGGTLRVEGRHPKHGAASALTLSCGDVKLDAKLQELIDSGRAKRESGDFRTLITAPASELLAACTLPTRLRAQMRNGSWNQATSRVLYLATPPACDYVGSGKTKVLLTAFAPFPADSSGENSSQAAVEAFDPKSVPGVSVSRVILPVEWDSAGAIVAEMIARCKPDVVIGFGQGRWRVEPETIAFNLQDTSDLAGGVPDNRGFVRDGQKVSSAGPASYESGLPTAKIAAALDDVGISAIASDDAGRYLCNEIFYRIMHAVAGTKVSGGFVHLPRQYTIDAAARERLGKVVRIVLETTLAARPHPAEPTASSN